MACIAVSADYLKVSWAWVVHKSTAQYNFVDFKIWGSKGPNTYPHPTWHLCYSGLSLLSPVFSLLKYVSNLLGLSDALVFSCFSGPHGGTHSVFNVFRTLNGPVNYSLLTLNLLIYWSNFFLCMWVLFCMCKEFIWINFIDPLPPLPPGILSQTLIKSLGSLFA